MGRFQSRDEIEMIKKLIQAPALDSISSAPASMDDKENTTLPSSESFTSRPATSQLAGDITFDDIRHNLTYDSSLSHIVKAMMHPDSKLGNFRDSKFKHLNRSV